MVKKVSDFDIELLHSTKEIIVALIEAKRLNAWAIAAGVDSKRVKKDVKAIADALREAV